MANKTIDKNKIDKESETNRIANDKGVSSTEWLENLLNQQLTDEETVYKILDCMCTTMLCGWPYKYNENDYKIHNKCTLSHLLIPYSFFKTIVKFFDMVFKKQSRFFFIFYFRMFGHKSK